MSYEANHAAVEAGVSFAVATIPAEALTAGVASRLAAVHSITASPAVDMGVSHKAQLTV